MNRVLFIALTVYLIGYLICVVITIPLIIWAVHEDEKEEGIYREGVTPDLFGRTVLVSILLSMLWFLLIPLYILVAAEKITGRGEDD